MNRAILLGAFAMLVGCGDDKHPGYVAPDSNGGARAAGGKYNKAGSAGMAGRAGSSGTSTRGASGGTAGDDSTEELGGSAGTAGYAGTAGQAGQAGYAGTAGDLGVAGVAGAAADRLAPVVAIVSPVEVTDPNAAGVLVGDTVDVTCSIVPGSAPGSTADPSSLRIKMSQASVQFSPITSNTPVGNSVTQRFSLSAISHGPAAITCTGYDSSMWPLSATTTINTLVDRGPVVEITDPKDKAPVSLNDVLPIKFKVSANPLPNLASIVDNKAAIKLPNLLVSSSNLTPTLALLDSGVYSYTASANFADRATFLAGTLPDGLTPIRVTASNLRDATTTAFRVVNVDSAPPTISITSPAPDASVVIGRNSQLIFEVIDPAVGSNPGTGVDIDSVTVIINNRPESYKSDKPVRWVHTHLNGVERFTFSFVLADLKDTGAQASIQITASDLARNATASGVTQSYSVDTEPPTVDLDPPTVRDVYTNGSNGNTCSSAFDPLGEAVSDKQIIAGQDFFRVLVWEQANAAPLLRFAGIDNTASTDTGTDAPVQLWLQTDVTKSLLIDTDNDENHYCDEIDKASATPKNLAPVTPGGTAPNILGDDTRYGTWIPASTCERAPFGALPAFMCDGNASDMLRVIRHDMVSSNPVPVVYGLPPLKSISCTGNFWELSPVIRTLRQPLGLGVDGWLCLAARAEDTVGNVGVSPIIQVCLDDPNEPGQPDCAKTVLSPPDDTTIPAWVRNWAGSNPVRLTPPRSGDRSVKCALGCTMRPQSQRQYTWGI